MAFTTSTLQAQEHALDARSLQIGGSASFASVDDDNFTDRRNTVTLNPRLHYFVIERLALGADLNLSYAKLSDDVSARTIGIGPSVTYYFGGPAATAHPYLSIRASIASVRFESGLQDTDGSNRSASGAAGILTMLSRSVGISTELFYETRRQEFDSQEGDSNTIGIAVGISAFVF